MNTTQQTLTAKDATPEEIDASKQHDESIAGGNQADESVFGPQTEQVHALFDRALALTSNERQLLATAYERKPDSLLRIPPSRIAEWRYACDSAKAGRSLPWAFDYLRNEETGAALAAFLRAVAGLLRRDLIGTEDITQDGYDNDTGPWRRTIGQIHPDDPRLP